MAKRKKKLNKKLVVSLSAVTVLVLMGVGFGVYRYRHKLFPQDPVVHAKAGMDAFEQGQYKLAEEELLIAIGAASGQDAEIRKRKALYCYDLGRVYLEWIKKDKELNDAERNSYLSKCLGAMREATTLDRTFLDPYKSLYNIYWELTYGRFRSGKTDVSWMAFIEAASALLGVDNDNAVAYYRRGLAWSSIGEQSADSEASKKGLADFRKAVSLDSSNVEFWKSWLILLSSMERRDPSIKVDAGFAEAFKANPHSAELRILYSSYLKGRDRPSEAAEQLREAIKCEPTSPKGHIAMAQHLARSEQYDAALKELDSAAKIDPTLASIYLQRSRINRRQKNLDGAVKSLQDGIAALGPKLSATAATQPVSRVTARLTEQMNSLNFSLANASLDLRRMTKDAKKQATLALQAEKCYEKLDNMPADSPHRAKLAGRLAIVKNKPLEAIENLEKAYKAFGLNDLQTPALLITLYDRVGRPGKSEKLLLMLQNAPRLQDSVEVMLGLARLKIRYKDYVAARSYVNKALRTDPQSEPALRLRSELQLLMGKTVTAAEAGRLSKAGIKAMVEQIDLKWIDGNPREALAMLSNLRKSLPKNMLLAERAINMHLILGEKETVKNILSQMLAIYPDNENLTFQRRLIDMTGPERLAMQIAQIDKRTDDPFARAWAKAQLASRAKNAVMYKQFMDEAIKLKPSHPGVIAMQFRNALKKGDWAAADKVIQRVEKDSELRGKTMRAQMLVIQKKYVEAIAVLVPLRKLHPDSKFVLRTLGECYLATKQIELAADVFGVLESNDPGDVSALIGMAIVTQNQGRMEDNEKYVLRAHRSPAGRKHSYISRRYLEVIQASATGDEIKKIIEQREKLHKLGPKKPNYLNNLAHLAMLCEYRTRDLARAEALYREAYEGTGHSPQWARTLAFFYARNGESSKGETILKTGISESKGAQAKMAWHIMYGEFLAMYNPKQAMRVFDQASRIDPKDPTPLRAKASLYAKFKRWPQAVQQMSAYVAKRGEDLRGRKTLIQYRINARQYDKAEAELEIILNRNPTDAQALLLKAVLLTLRGSPAKAVVVATQAIEKHPDLTDALPVRARAYMVMGELEMARSDLAAARRVSKSPQVSMELAEVYRLLGRYNDALLVLKSVVAEYRTYGAGLQALINMYISSKDWPNAEASLADAHKRFPKETAYWMIEAGMWGTRGQQAKVVGALAQARSLNKESVPIARAHLLALLESGQVDKAMTTAEGYKTKPLWSTWVNAIIARIMVYKKDSGKADELFLSAVSKANPNELPFVVNQIRAAYGPKIAIQRMLAWSKQHPGAWYVKVLIGDLCSVAVAAGGNKMAAVEKKQYLKLAIDSYNESLAKTKKPADVAMLSSKLGRVYYDMGEPREAEKAYKKCLEITPDDHAALNNLAYLYVEDLNDPEKALPYVQKVIKLRAQDPNVLDTYGWVMGRLKRYAEAKKYLQRSIERDPKLAASRFHLGWVFEQEPNRKQALTHYRLGLELLRDKPNQPLYKQLEAALKRLGT